MDVYRLIIRRSGFTAKPTYVVSPKNATPAWIRGTWLEIKNIRAAIPWIIATDVIRTDVAEDYSEFVDFHLPRDNVRLYLYLSTYDHGGA